MVPFGMAVKTRLMYVVIFLAAIVSCWVFITWGAEWYDKVPPAIFDKSFCVKEHCFGALSVYRISFGLALFHGLQSLLMIGVRRTSDCRAWLQNGFWLFKLLALVGLIVGAFFIPMPFFVYYGWTALVCSVIFLFIQLVLLVDFAHSWSESWLAKYNDDPTQIIWMRLLIFCTVVIDLAALGACIAMYALFASSVECGLNAAFITIALLSGILLSCLAVHPKVQERSPQSGLLQPAVVFFYMVFLVWSAIMSEPLDSTVFFNKLANAPCNNVSKGDGTWGTGNQKFGTLMGMLLVVVAVCYSALRASTQHDTLLGKVDAESAPINGGAQSIEDVAAAADGKYVSSDTEGGATTAAPADEPVGYNYSFFHIIFMLASMYICMLMTNWSVVHGNTVDDVMSLNMTVSGTPPSAIGNGSIDQSEASVWIKVASSWFVALLFMWSLVAPIVFADRQFGA